MWRVLCGHAQCFFAEEDLFFTYIAAKQHLVTRGRLAVGAALGTEEANIACMVLAATVGAAGDVDSYSADFGKPFFFKRLTNCLGETT